MGEHRWKFSRREALALSALVATGSAGCLSNDSGAQEATPTYTPTPEGDYPDHAGLGEQVKHVDEMLTIPKGDYEPYQISADGSSHWIEYDLLVTEGGPIDVFMLDSENYNKYVQGENAEFYSVWSVVGEASANKSMFIDSDWVLVVDNTPWRTEPHGEVTVNFELELATAFPGADDE